MNIQYVEKMRKEVMTHELAHMIESSLSKTQKQQLSQLQKTYQIKTNYGDINLKNYYSINHWSIIPLHKEQ